MKELNNIDRSFHKKEVHAEKKNKKEVEYKLQESISPFKGHKVYEINLETLEVIEAEFVKRKYITWFDAIKHMNGHYKKDVLVKNNCVYVSALNPKSALDRYNKNKGSAIKPKGSLKLKLF